MGGARPSRAEAEARIADGVPRLQARPARGILGRHFHGRRTIRLWAENDASVEEAIDDIGHVPLPLTSSATIPQTIGSGIRPCTRANEDRCGADCRAAFHSRHLRRTRKSGGLSARRSRCTSATEFFSRCVSPRSRHTRERPSAFPSASRQLTNHQSREARVAPRRHRRNDDDARAGVGRASRPRHHHSSDRLDESFHLPGLPVLHRGCADDELSSAAIVAVDAGQRVWRAGGGARRLPGSRSAGIPLL